jgi:hypothetical protein
MTGITSHYRAPITLLGPEVEAYVLDEIDGQKETKPRCVLSKRGSANALGLQSDGGSAFWRTLTRKGIGSVMPEKLREKLDNPIIFRYIDTGSESAEKAVGRLVHGYDTSTFIEVLKVLMDARRTGKLSKTQQFLADRAEAMLLSLANTTLDSIVYQETGFWKAIEGQRVSEILEKYLQDHARKWAKTFPDEFWTKLIKVKGYPSYVALKRPGFVGHWINDIVYDRLAPGIRKKLNQINPRLPSGRRKSMHHQHTTKDHGLPELRDHLVKVQTLMDAAANDMQFMRLLNRSLPKFEETYEMPFDDL